MNSDIVAEILRRDDAGENVVLIGRTMGVHIGAVYSVLRKYRPNRERRIPVRTSEARHCIACGKEFETKLRGRYSCSRECSRAIDLERSKVWRRANPGYAVDYRATHHAEPKDVRAVADADDPVRYSVTMNIRLTPEMCAMIRKAAKAKGQKPSECIRQAIQSALGVTGGPDTV